MHCPVGPVVLPVDHVGFGTADLDAAITKLTSLGLGRTAVSVTTWPTPTADQQARSVSVLFEDGYLDIIEIPTVSAPDQVPIYPTGVVLRSVDVDTTRHQLMADGVRCGRPYGIDRHFESGDAPAHYKVFGVDRPHSSGLPMAIIETVTTIPMTPQVETVAEAASTLVTGAQLLGVDLA